MSHLRAIEGGAEDAERFELVTELASVLISPAASAMVDCAKRGDMYGVRSFLLDLEESTAAVREVVGPHEDAPRAS